MTSNRICHVHNGAYVYKDGKDGCQHPSCVAFRELDIQPRVVMGIGETHPEYYKKQNHKKFNDDMSAYREAVRNGISPEKVSRKAVEAAEKRAYREGLA